MSVDLMGAISRLIEVKEGDKRLEMVRDNGVWSVRIGFNGEGWKPDFQVENASLVDAVLNLTGEILDDRAKENFSAAIMASVESMIREAVAGNGREMWPVNTWRTPGGFVTVEVRSSQYDLNNEAEA